MSRERIAFGDCELDPESGELLRCGTVVPTEPRVLDLIAYLAHRPGELIGKDALVEAVWNGRVISDSAISSCIAAARAAIGDDGTMQRLIRTVPRRGFRFVGHVGTAGSTDPHSQPPHRRPAIAVLPFENMSGDPEQAYFSDGITDDVITDLSRYGELFVIARHSSFAHRDSGRGVDEIARDLGVQYVVEGAVRRVGDRVRITVRLVDAMAGNELWAERYDRELEDIFDVQDEITLMIVNRLVGQIARQHRMRSMASGTDITAYDCLLRAQKRIFSVNHDEAREGLADARRALDLDPNSARAHAMISWYFVNEGSNCWGLDPDEALDEARKAALAAVSADDGEPFAPIALAWVHLWRDRNHERALAELRRACAFNPGNAGYRSFLAFAQIYAGEHEAGKASLDGAMRLNPHYPALYDNHYMRALFHLRRSEAALPHAERVALMMPQASNALSLVAAIFASLEMHDEARAVVERIVKISPGFTRSFAERRLPYRREEDLAHYLDMLRIAGLPE